MTSQAQYRRFRTLLIANRGEIAARVIRTARAMGLRTVAVYSEADRDAMHVAMADEAVLLGPARARDSYLNIARVIEVARQSGAEAVHPGYGFLSENAEFAQACADAGLVFVGPTAAMMTAMGSKSGAKALMEKAGVPLVPGYHGEAQDDATLTKAADKIGFPVLVKASAGGGGRGMRIVRSAGELAAAIASATIAAMAAIRRLPNIPMFSPACGSEPFWSAPARSPDDMMMTLPGSGGASASAAAAMGASALSALGASAFGISAATACSGAGPEGSAFAGPCGGA